MGTAVKISIRKTMPKKLPNGKYLMETTSPGKRQFHNTKDLQEWGEINEWTKLEIVNKPSMNKVEFKAYYTDENGHRSSALVMRRDLR